MPFVLRMQSLLFGLMLGHAPPALVEQRHEPPEVLPCLLDPKPNVAQPPMGRTGLTVPEPGGLLLCQRLDGLQLLAPGRHGFFGRLAERRRSKTGDGVAWRSPLQPGRGDDRRSPA